jgi:hypothetical protein
MYLSNAGDRFNRHTISNAFFIWFTQQERSFPPTRKGAFVCIKRFETAKIEMHRFRLTRHKTGESQRNVFDLVRFPISFGAVR